MARASLREGRKFKKHPFCPPEQGFCGHREIVSVFYVYILRSIKTGKLYIGHTDNLARRFEEHNTGRGGKYTRQNGPWELVYSENHPDRSSAAKREWYLKSTSGSYEKKKLAGVLKQDG